MKIIKNELGSRGSGSGDSGFLQNPIIPIMNVMKVIENKWDARGPGTGSDHQSLRQPQASSLKPLGLGGFRARPGPARCGVARPASGWPARVSGNVVIPRIPIINIMKIMNNKWLVAATVPFPMGTQKMSKSQ